MTTANGDILTRHLDSKPSFLKKNQSCFILLCTAINVGILTLNLLLQQSNSQIMVSLQSGNSSALGKNESAIKTDKPIQNTCTNEFRQKHMVTSKLVGRTGNILFQLASVIGTADLTCYKPVILRNRVRHLDEIFEVKNVERLNSTKPFKSFNEPGYAKFQSGLEKIMKHDYNWSMLGYRQSFLYFENVKDKIKSSFIFKDNVKENVTKYLNSESFQNKVTVGLHVRRTDFLRLSKHGVSDIHFVNRSIEYMINKTRPSQMSLIVVSDDIKWCRQNIKGDFVQFSPFKSAGMDLYLLTQCYHVIISTGSFGWWGAWLNETGTVVYDNKPGLYPGGMNRTQYFPSHWIPL